MIKVVFFQFAQIEKIMWTYQLKNEWNCRKIGNTHLDTNHKIGTLFQLLPQKYDFEIRGKHKSSKPKKKRGH